MLSSRNSIDSFDSIFENPEQLKQLSLDQLPHFSEKLRQMLLTHAQQFGGHFASSLGVVELTLALHYSFNFPKDKLIWDTGHQSYAHKLLSKRANALSTIRTFGGLHPFCSFKESAYDFGISGHAGNSISLAIGACFGRFRSDDSTPWIISVTGDGALESGLALEALDKLHHISGKFLIIINFNGQSIDPTVGAKAQWFEKIFSSDYSQESLRQILGIHAPIRVEVLREGNDVSQCVSLFQTIHRHSQPTVVVIKTTKGRGFAPAETAPTLYHTYPKSEKKEDLPTYSKIFGRWLCHKAQSDKTLRVICPAMVHGSGLKQFSQQFSSQFLDVGIAEGHALAAASGAALMGAKVAVAIYSTFLQRAYDQILHDLALPKLPVILAIDRAGFAGGDGETHHGLYDVAFLYSIPNISLLTPSSAEGLIESLNAAYQCSDGPIAIRYPKKRALRLCDLAEAIVSDFEMIAIQNPNERYFSNNALESRLIWNLFQPKNEFSPKGLLLNFGTWLPQALTIAKEYSLHVLDVPIARPFPEKLFFELSKQFKHWIVLEESSRSGGIGMQLRDWASQYLNGIKMCTLGVPCSFFPHGTIDDLEQFAHFTPEKMSQKIEAFLMTHP